MYSIGDRVLGQWEPEWFYSATVVGTGAEGISIYFDDGERRIVLADQLRPLLLVPGMRIHSRWKGDPAYYPGVVASVTGAALEIHYDDGDREVSIVAMARFHVSDL